MNTRTIAALALAALFLVPAAAGADEVQEAVTKLLASHTTPQVLVKFDLKRADGQGGREVTLQGTVVSADGLVLVTGANQVDPQVGSNETKPESIKVHFPNDVKHDARFVGKDEELNLAVVRIDLEEGAKPPTAAAFAGKAAMTPGQQLIVLQRLGKDDDDLVTFSVVRIAAVVPKPGLPHTYRLLGNLRGSEGSPVFSLDTKLVGFVTGGTRSPGRRGGRFQIVGGRLVPMGGGGGGRSGGMTRILDATTVKEFLADPTRGMRRDCWLGVSGLQALTKDLAEALGLEKKGGLVLGEVSKKSPAENAGFKPGDVLVSLDGEALAIDKDRDIASFQRKIKRAPAGAKHTFQVFREGEEGWNTMKLSVRLEEAPLAEDEIRDYHDKSFGLKLKPLTRDFLERSRLPLDLTGVRVTWVEPAGWASIAGIRGGDVIQKMVLKKCPDLETYKKIMTELMKTKDSEVCYNVSRSRKSLFLCVRPDWTRVETGK